MGKFMLWLLGIFPQWKPDPAVAAVWAGELPDVTAQQAVVAVKKMQARRPCPFPPSVFEIVHELSGGADKLEGRRSWQRVLELVRTKGVDAYPYPELAEKEMEAVRLMGGIKVIGNSEVGDPFFEKRFLEVFDNVKEEINVLRIGGAVEVRQITDGEGLRGDDRGGQDERGLARRDDGA